MQKLIETAENHLEIEIPADKQADVKKALSEHYKNAAEHNKALSKLETETRQLEREGRDSRRNAEKV